MLKVIIPFILLFLCVAPARALTAEVVRIDAGTSYSLIQDTAAVKYVDRCTRGKFAPYEWTTWEGYYSARAYIMPLAVITVRRGKNEMFGGDLTPYINMAQQEARNMGANLFCFIQMKKNKQILEPDAVIFRAYKQLFQAGNAGWEAFFNDLMNQGVLLTLQDLQLGEKTREALERQNAAQKVQPR